jgi:flavin-dependent dehydrogenase
MEASAKEKFDVIVIGAGLAGCTAARLFALKGLQVALVEHHADAQAFKQLCTHFIQASATPTLRRLGIDRLIEQAGGVRNGVDIWTRYQLDAGFPMGLNLSASLVGTGCDALHARIS